MVPRVILLSALALAGCRPAAAPTGPHGGAAAAPTQATPAASAEPTEASAPLPAEVDSPAQAGGRLPGVTAGDDGRLHLAWLEPAEEGGRAVRASAWDGQAWSAPETVAEGPDIVDHWTASPSIAARADGSRAVQWLTSSAIGEMGTDVRVAIARGPGAPWELAPAAHAPAREAENGFAEVQPSAEGFELLWLDGANQEEGPADASGLPDVGLRHVSLGPNGALGAAHEVDGRACDCCAVDADARPDGLVVAYRDRSPEEMRDIALSRFAGGRWSAPHLVHDDGWRISACPVNGPAVDTEGDAAVVAWYTAAPDGPPRVLAAWSADGGETFGQPRRVDLGRPEGHVDAVLLADGTALVSWLEGDGLWVRRMSADGLVASLAAHVPGASSEGGRPRLALLAGDVWLAWADGARDGRLHVGRVATE